MDNPRKAFLFLGFTILAWTIFWNTGFRIWATYHAAKKGESPAASGLLIAI